MEKGPSFENTEEAEVPQFGPMSEDLAEHHIDKAIDDVNFRLEVAKLAATLKDSKDSNEIKLYHIALQILGKKIPYNDPISKTFRHLRD